MLFTWFGKKKNDASSGSSSSYRRPWWRSDRGGGSDGDDDVSGDGHHPRDVRGNVFVRSVGSVPFECRARIPAAASHARRGSGRYLWRWRRFLPIGCGRNRVGGGVPRRDGGGGGRVRCALPAVAAKRTTAARAFHHGACAAPVAALSSHTVSVRRVPPASVRTTADKSRRVSPIIIINRARVHKLLVLVFDLISIIIMSSLTYRKWWC